MTFYFQKEQERKYFTKILRSLNYSNVNSRTFGFITARS